MTFATAVGMLPCMRTSWLQLGQQQAEFGMANAVYWCRCMSQQDNKYATCSATVLPLLRMPRYMFVGWIHVGLRCCKLVCMHCCVTVMGWPTDMMDSSRTTWTLAVGVPVGDRAPVMTTCSNVSSSGAKAAST